ncbi:MAG: acyl-CoA/acyl-ACP dehydrogenase [Pseudomonadales bacterium]|nr:acyl-CoA/acyl-ACP dehydrogenase [Pseudomonadales bacterium]
MATPKDFGFTEDISMLKDTFAKFLSEQKTIENLRPSLKGTEDPYHGDQRSAFYDTQSWQQTVELGIHAVSIPEDQGGIGMGLVAATAIAEEIGRYALATPLTNTLLATFLLRAIDSPEGNALLEAMAGGTRVGIALYGEDASLEGDSTDVRVEDDKLQGQSWYVTDAQKSEILIVAAESAEGVDLYRVDCQSANVRVLDDRIVDLTRDQARIQFDGAEAQALTTGGRGLLSFQKALPALLTLTAADIAGAAEWQLQTTAEYAKVRSQFDRPIGFFQAVKHPIVDMMITADETRSLVYQAAAAFDFEPEDAARCAHLAKSSASDTAEFCANRSTQLHGGIGFTWEADVQIYHKRQMHSQFLFGDGIWQRAKLAELL